MRQVTFNGRIASVMAAVAPTTHHDASRVENNRTPNPVRKTVLRPTKILLVFCRRRLNCTRFSNTAVYSPMRSNTSGPGSPRGAAIHHALSISVEADYLKVSILPFATSDPLPSARQQEPDWQSRCGRGQSKTER